MRKDEKREIFDAVLTKALRVDYSEFLVSLSERCKVPKNFPGEYGVRSVSYTHLTLPTTPYV